MNKIKDILIIVLAGVIVYLILTRPEPDTPPKVVESQKKVDSLQVEIDSLIRERERLIEQLRRDSTESARIIKQKDVKIARLNSRINELDIKSLPVPELDSIVRNLYGPDAVPSE